MAHERPDVRQVENDEGKIKTIHNDWEGLTWAKMSWSQRIAKITGGALTIPNVVSVAGAAITATGLYQYTRGNYAIGTGLVLGGRGADILDGMLASILKVRGKFGAMLDASLDKVVGVAALGALTYTGDFSPATTAAIAATQAGIVYENSLIQQRGGKATPSFKGKLATFALWGAGGAYMAASTAEAAGYETASTILRYGGHAAAVGAIALGASAWHDYHKSAGALQQSPDATV